MVGFIWRPNRVAVKHGVLIVVIYSVCSACVYNALRCYTCRDGEKASVTLNGKECWSQALSTSLGEPVCGGDGTGRWGEGLIAVKCEGEAASGKLAVRVSTTLDQESSDESFAIDNVVVRRISAGTAYSLVVCTCVCMYVSWNDFKQNLCMHGRLCQRNAHHTWCTRIFGFTRSRTNYT